MLLKFFILNSSFLILEMEKLEKFIVERLSPIPEVAGIRSSFALKQVRYKTALPLKHSKQL